MQSLIQHALAPGSTWAWGLKESWGCLLPLISPLWSRDTCAFSNLFRGVLQADEFSINVYLLNRDTSSGKSWVGNANTTAGFRLLHINPLPLPFSCTHSTARRSPWNCHSGRWAWRKLQSILKRERNMHDTWFYFFHLFYKLFSSLLFFP